MILSATETLKSVPVILVVPGTSQLAATRFPFTTRIEASATNGLTVPSVFVGFQLQAVNPRLVSFPRAGFLSEDELCRIEDSVLGALGFDLPE